jgi:hypothetical protein
LDGTRKPMSSIIIMISIEKPPVDGFIWILRFSL